MSPKVEDVSSSERHPPSENIANGSTWTCMIDSNGNDLFVDCAAPEDSDFGSRSRHRTCKKGENPSGRGHRGHSQESGNKHVRRPHSNQDSERGIKSRSKARRESKGSRQKHIQVDFKPRPAPKRTDYGSMRVYMSRIRCENASVDGEKEEASDGDSTEDSSSQSDLSSLSESEFTPSESSSDSSGPTYCESSAVEIREEREETPDTVEITTTKSDSPSETPPPTGCNANCFLTPGSTMPFEELSIKEAASSDGDSPDTPLSHSSDIGPGSLPSSQDSPSIKVGHATRHHCEIAATGTQHVQSPTRDSKIDEKTPSSASSENLPDFDSSFSLSPSCFRGMYDELPSSFKSTSDSPAPPSSSPVPMRKPPLKRMRESDPRLNSQTPSAKRSRNSGKPHSSSPQWDCFTLSPRTPSEKASRCPTPLSISKSLSPAEGQEEMEMCSRLSCRRSLAPSPEPLSTVGSSWNDTFAAEKHVDLTSGHRRTVSRFRDLFESRASTDKENLS